MEWAPLLEWMRAVVEQGMEGTGGGEEGMVDQEREMREEERERGAGLCRTFYFSYFANPY